MGDTDTKCSETSQYQKSDKRSKNSNTNSKTAVQNIEKCALSTVNKFGSSYTLTKQNAKIQEAETTDEQITTDSATTPSEKFNEIPCTASKIPSDSSIINNVNSNQLKSQNTSAIGSVDEPSNSVPEKLPCIGDISTSLETSANFIPAFTASEKCVRKRNTDNSGKSKHVNKSEKEFVIYHEHCENVDRVSNSEVMDDIVRDVSQHPQYAKFSLQGLRNDLNQEPVDLPENVIYNFTKSKTKGLYNSEILVWEGSFLHTPPPALYLHVNMYLFHCGGTFGSV